MSRYACKTSFSDIIPIIALFFLFTIGMLSPTNFDNFFITKIKFELGSMIRGFFSIKFIKFEPFLLIKFKRLILPIYVLSSDTIYPSVVLDLVNNLMALSMDVVGFSFVY